MVRDYNALGLTFASAAELITSAAEKEATGGEDAKAEADVFR
jgi:hypothetical protein